MSTQISGIDVSKHNGAIDWKKVAGSGVKFVFVRIGWAGYDGQIAANGGLDSLFHTNVKGALAAGLDVGVYVYAYCKSAAAAITAARETLELIAPYRITYPVAFDMEIDGSTPFQNNSKAVNNAIAAAFMDEVEKGGYYAMLYTFYSFTQQYLDMSSLKKYDLWLAHHATSTPYKGHGIWQHHGDAQKDRYGNVTYPAGSCPGISGACDLNTAYKDYAAIIKAAGLNGLGKPQEEQPGDFTLEVQLQNAKKRIVELEQENSEQKEDISHLNEMCRILQADKGSLSDSFGQITRDIHELSRRWPV